MSDIDLSSVDGYKLSCDNTTENWKCCGVTLSIFTRASMCITAVCFCLSGIILLMDEYGNIPNCANTYGSWCITMTVLSGLYCMVSVLIVRPPHVSWRKLRFVGCVVVIVCSLIGSIGYRDVWIAPDANCDIDQIHGLRTWTIVMILFNCLLTVLGLITMLVSCYQVRVIRLHPSLYVA